jgi:ketosteroid isomerase-like protein
MNSAEIITAFYTAFQRKDYRTMQALYHKEASFSDPVFKELDSVEVRAMWEMLLTSSKDLRIEFKNVKASDGRGACEWEAWYSFSRTKRRVHNKISATFEFKDGKIFRHHDTFDLWRWSGQALGLSGILLGWTSVLQNKIRETARSRLDQFLKR